MGIIILLNYRVQKVTYSILSFLGENGLTNDNDQSIETRAGYLFRTRKSFPSMSAGNIIELPVT